MEITKQTRPIEYDLNYSEAKQWYESGNETLRNLAIGRFPELEKPQLPKSWEEFLKMYEIEYESSKYFFFSEEQAQASIALAKLSHLREVYRQGWVPDWEDSKLKDCIIKDTNIIKRYGGYFHNRFLAFQDNETANLFLSNFKDLIEQASPLLFG